MLLVQARQLAEVSATGAVVLGGSATPSENVVTFLAYQALTSMGFAIAFIWLYERITGLVAADQGP